MKRTLALILCVLLSCIPVALADTYSLDEILPSIPGYSDVELETLLNAIVDEQNSRSISAQPDEPEIVIDNTPITEREDYIERVTVQRGDKSDDAKVLQERLIELGYLNGSADGDFGKKSEAAVMAFQKANGLDQTGIADSITQYVMYSSDVIDKEAYDNMPIAVGDGWEITKEYYYKTKWDSSYIFIIKNTSGYNAEISVNVIFYDAEENIVGVGNGSEVACESGYETYWSFSNDDIEFDHVTVNVTLSADKYYRDGGQSCLDISHSIVNNKVIITAKNNGKETVEFAEYHVLFLDDSGEVVSTGWGYLTDDDSEIKPGSIEMREETSYNDFSDVRVYVHGRIDK